MTTKHTGGPAFAWYDPTTGLFTRNKNDPDSGIPAGSCLWPLYREAPTLHSSDSGAPNAAEPIVSDVEAIVRLLESHEWAEHVATTPLGQRLETAVTVLVGAAQQPSEPASTQFELVQDGIPVASSSGPREEAWREIQHYAAQYSEDGPVEIFEITRRRIEGEL